MVSRHVIYIILVLQVYLVSHINTLSMFKKVVAELSNLIFCNELFFDSKIDNSLSMVRKKIFGQPFVPKTLLPTLVNHYKEHKEPLALYFNGPIGVGKSMVADHILNSKFFINRYFFNLSPNVNPTEETILEYQEFIRDRINFIIRKCSRSVFVFDDISWLPPNFLYNLPPYNKDPDVDYSESLFIYVSQTDSDNIISATRSLIAQGKDRRDLNIKEFQETMKSISQGKFALLSPLSEMFGHIWAGFTNTLQEEEKPKVKEVYIPFLPLEIEHVKNCINVIVREKWSSSLADETMRKVLQNSGCDLTNKHNFCDLGCKIVDSKIVIFNEHNEL